MLPQILGRLVLDPEWSYLQLGLGRSRQSGLIPPGPILDLQFSLLGPEAISDPGEILGIVFDPEWGALQRVQFGLLGYTFSLQNKSWSHSWVRHKTDLCPEAVSDPSEIPDAIGIALDVLILREVLSSPGRGNTSNISPSSESLLKLNSSLMPPQVFMTDFMMF